MITCTYGATQGDGTQGTLKIGVFSAYFLIHNAFMHKLKFS